MDKDTTAIVEGFIDYLKKNKKIDLLSEIVALLKKRLDEEELKGKVISAVSLGLGEMESLENLLQKKLGKKIKMVNVVDKKIIGGLIIKYKDLVIDQSLKRKLNEIKKEIYGY